MKMYSLEEKFEVVKRLLSGERISSLVRETGIKGDIIRLWRLRYEKYGEKGLESFPRGICHSEEKKIAAMHDYYEKDLTLLQIANKYDISRQVVSVWAKQYRSLGSRQRSQKVVAPEKLFRIMAKEMEQYISSDLSFLKDKSLSDKKKIEILKEKLLYSQAEAAYLKKVKALVQEEKAQRLKQGCESSKN